MRDTSTAPPTSTAATAAIFARPAAEPPAAEPLAIVHAVTSLDKSLRMISTAEGVETQQQWEKLQAIGCTEMQGHFFSQARPAGEIVELFLRGAAEQSADAA